ncbi:hypothetical protein C8R48DRAFT_787880 [Suillus tomentosus]|nr:hypothetical protein C8R48DRAFT_787880 [Suillus tomentosus]
MYTQLYRSIGWLRRPQDETMSSGVGSKEPSRVHTTGYSVGNRNEISAIHPNIPSPKHTSQLHGLWRQVRMVIMALIAPELIVTWAMRQWFSTDQVTRKFEELGYPSVRPEYEGILLAFVCLFRLLAEGILSVLKSLWRVLYAPVKWAARWIKSEKSESGLEEVYRRPYPNGRPDPRQEKRQCDIKRIGRPSSSLLEVGTLAFAVLNFLTYAAWWDKPLNVQCPHPVYWKSTKSKSIVTPEYVIGVSEEDKIAQFGILAPVLRPMLELIGFPGIPSSRELQVPTFDGSIKLEQLHKHVLLLAGLLMATIFGGIHCMAWFFAFPTYQERVLWRMSAVAITFTPWLGLLTAPLLAALDASLTWFILLYVPYIMLYITARGVLLVLMFTTLRDLPPDAYQTVLWTSLVPHL